jgi:hypothetical protein
LGIQATLPLLREPLSGTVEYVGRQWGARLRTRGPREGMVECRLVTTTGSIVLLRLPAGDRRDDWLTVECAIRHVMAPPSATDGHSTYLVRWRWAWCPDGVDAVGDRVAHLLGVRSHELSPANFRRVEGGGGLYAFEPDALRYADRTLAERLRAACPADAGSRDSGSSRRASRGDREAFQTTLRLHRPFAALRAQERVRVDLPCRYVVSADELSGWLRDVSRAGLFVTTRWTFPAVGQRVAVAFTTILDGHRQRFVLTGVTRRVVTTATLRAEPDGSPDASPGFGVEVDSVVDGQRGERFQRYLDLLLRATGDDAVGASAVDDPLAWGKSAAVEAGAS